MSTVKVLNAAVKVLFVTGEKFKVKTLADSPRLALWQRTSRPYNRSGGVTE